MKPFSTIALGLCVALTPLAVLAGGSHSGGHPEKKMSHWQAPPEMARRPNPVKKTEEALEQARELYLNNCAVCHGRKGRGDGPAAESLRPGPADLAAMAGNHQDGDFAWKISRGRGAMPGWSERLSEEQIWLLVHFIQGLGRDEKADRHH